MKTHTDSISDPLKLHYIRRVLLGMVESPYPPELCASLVVVMDSFQVIDGLKELEIQDAVLTFLGKGCTTGAGSE